MTRSSVFADYLDKVLAFWWNIVAKQLSDEALG